MKLQPNGHTTNGIGERGECCRVCGAEGNAGRHYGSICCSGCKGFFRRSVRFQKLYHCPYAQQCAISKTYRNCCRACRYEKCLRVGLDPNLVQSDWGQCNNGQQQMNAKGRIKKPTTNGGLKIKVKEEPLGEERMKEESQEEEEARMISMVTNGVRAEGIGNSTDCNNNNCHNSVHSYPLIWHNWALHNGFSTHMALGMTKAVSPVPNHLNGHFEPVALANYLVQVDKYCDLFADQQTSPVNSQWDLVRGQYENVPIEVAFRQPGLLSRRWPIVWRPKELEQGGTIFASLYCRLLTHCLDWASHLPELMELNEEDRKLLLKRRLMRQMWWCLAQRSIPFIEGPHPQGMVVSGEMFYPREPQLQEKLDPCLRGLLTDAVNMSYDELIQPMREHKVSQAEGSLLRAISFFTPVPRLSPEGHRQVLSFQNKYLNALTELVMNRRELPEDVPGMKSPMERMSRMLMLLTTLEQVARLSDDSFAMFCTFNMNGMRGLLNYELHMSGN